MNSLGNKEIMAGNIKRLTDAHNMTIKDLASAIEVPYTTVCSWCQADTYPRIDKIEKMANLFNCSKAALVENLSSRIDEALKIIKDYDDGISKPIYLMQSLNQEGIDAVTEYIEILLGNPKYKK